jgi:alpha-tubulin suppressor-like RCC1 family protein
VCYEQRRSSLLEEMTVSATSMRWGAALSLVVSVGCIELPVPLEERRPAAAFPSGGGGQGGDGPSSGGKGGGGAGAGTALPICPPGGQGADCARVTALAPGESQTCALASDGHVRCWGDNLAGQLGNPAEPKLTHLPPVLVAQLTEAVAIDCGFRHCCALAEGKAYCWGSNAYGQLGLGDTADRDAPAALPVDDVVAVSTRRDSTCVLTSDDEVRCAGKLLNGQPYSGEQLDPTLVTVGGLDDFGPIGSLEVGQVTACVVREDGLAMRCWGDNGNGYVGDGTTDDRPIPVDVTDALNTPVAAVSAGSGWTCTVASSLQCWGNFLGLFGQIFAEPTALPTVTTTGLLDVGTGWAHLCMHDMAGGVSCLGRSAFYELGPEVPLGQSSSVPVFVVGDVARLEVGWQHSCVLVQSGEVRCWGRNHLGQVVAGDARVEIPHPTVVPLR